VFRSRTTDDHEHVERSAFVGEAEPMVLDGKLADETVGEGGAVWEVLGPEAVGPGRVAAVVDAEGTAAGFLKRHKRVLLGERRQRWAGTWLARAVRIGTGDRPSRQGEDLKRIRDLRSDPAGRADPAGR
jgi:hypothetical protein